jgi:hypothetical protein
MDNQKQPEKVLSLITDIKKHAYSKNGKDYDTWVIMFTAEAVYFIKIGPVTPLFKLFGFSFLSYFLGNSMKNDLESKLQNDFDNGSMNDISDVLVWFRGYSRIDKNNLSQIKTETGDENSVSFNDINGTELMIELDKDQFEIFTDGIARLK